jgi:phenylalanyl-tRNA synthetase alpha chain
MQKDIDCLLEQASADLESSQDLPSLDRVRVRFLGKKGELTSLLKAVSSLPKEQKPLMGQAVNQAKRSLNEQIERRKKQLEALLLAHQLRAEKVDVSLAGARMALGQMHPVTQVKNRVMELFNHLGFNVAEGPEIEDDYHNFSALNIPEHHPARALQDTFYVEGEKLLRTHTSPVQIRVMERLEPPLRIITPGRVFRCDSDQTHTPMFHQCEGLLVDKNTSFAQLKGVLHDFLRLFFETDVDVRFRPSYFPFTEPSAEVDIRRKDSDKWLEVMGCGMVHPNVLKHVNIDPDEYLGFAFGLGLDRLAMLRYGVSDLRMMFENDLRFLQQF